MSHGRSIKLSDQIKPGTGSGKRRLEQNAPEPNCLGCGMIIELERRITRTEGDLHIANQRISHSELNAARLEGIIEGLPDLIDAKFNALITVLKTRDSISNSIRLGQDIENSSPPPKHGQSDLKLPMGARLRGSQWFVGIVMVIIALISGVAYTAAKWGPPEVKQQTIGGK